MTVKITSFLPSIPSYSTNMMTSRRDHPFNKSTRPLLLERKPQFIMKRKTINNSDSRSSDSTNTKMHHGFNDFDDIMTQQFNQNINSHVGYPYGSPPPSPTVNSSDFVFSEECPGNGNNNLLISSHSHSAQNYHHQQQQQNQQKQLESMPKPYPPSACDEDHFFANENQLNYKKPMQISNRITEFSNWCSNKLPQNYQQQEQLYENQSTANNNNYNQHVDHNRKSNQTQPNILNNNSKNDYNIIDEEANSDGNYDQIEDFSNISGPFIFGVHNPSNINFKDSNNSSTITNIATNAAVINSSRKYFFNKNKKWKPVVFNQTISDTSSTSKEGEKESKTLVKGRTKLIKSEYTDDADKKKEKYQPNIKCVLVGDGAVGKTNLIVSYLENRFIAEHIPTASDIYNAEVMVNDNPVDVCLCDTAGQDTLDPLRELCYPDSDVFLLCYSIVKPESFSSIKTKWAPKFSKSKAALILVGTQADLRSDSFVLNKLQTRGEKPISFADACDLATSIGAKYIETSSLTQEKVKDVFDAAIWEALLPNHLPPKPALWKRFLCLA